VTSDSTTLDSVQAADDDGRMFCYRHPDRETYVRCGRCDRPICTRCAMQGPVGFRCKQCGTLANDPLTTIRPTQAALGLGVAVGGGVVVGLIAGALGFFTIFISFFAGGVISEAVVRVTGYKRGPVMLAIVFGGMVSGIVLGTLLMYEFQAGHLVGPGANGVFVGINVVDVVIAALPWLLISAGAACVGAYSRLR
jgi:hypothetical protein